VEEPGTETEVKRYIVLVEAEERARPVGAKASTPALEAVHIEVSGLAVRYMCAGVVEELLKAALVLHMISERSCTDIF